MSTLTGSLVSAVALLATPALANSSASADISAPLRAAAGQSAAQTGGDQNFHQLFASWQAADQGAGISAVPGITGSGITAPKIVSIPSLVPVEGFRLTSEFGMRWHPILGGRRQHEGVDLAGPIGTPVHATADGVVGRADWFSGYGLFVQLEHGGDLETRYGHMSRLNVEAGQTVHKGDVIGYIGMTGRTTGPHLHYEVRIAGTAVNPIPYMQGAGTGVLDVLPVATTTVAKAGGAAGAAETGED